MGARSCTLCLHLRVKPITAAVAVAEVKLVNRLSFALGNLKPEASSGLERMPFVANMRSCPQ